MKEAFYERKTFTCYKKIFTNINAIDAFNMLGNEKFYCLVYSPNFCGFSSPDKYSDIFEMRCFNENFELRWIKNVSTSGDAVLISEKNEINGFDLEKEKENFYKRSSKYLLWGTTIKKDDKIFLFEHRIGEIEIPMNVDSGKKIFLNFDEFFSRDPEYGNIIRRFERLTGLCAGD